MDRARDRAEPSGIAAAAFAHRLDFAMERGAVDRDGARLPDPVEPVDQRLVREAARCVELARGVA